MVNLIVSVTDTNGIGIVGIPVSGTATKTVAWGTNYKLPLMFTNANGNAVYDNVEANESFNVIVNSPLQSGYSSLWSSSTGIGNSTLLSSPTISIVLKKILPSINGSCQSGYSLVNGQCQENTGISGSSSLNSVMSFLTKYYWVFILIAIVLVILILAVKHKSSNKPIIAMSNPSVIGA